MPPPLLVPPLHRVHPMTAVATPKAIGKRMRFETARSLSPISRTIASVEGFKVEDPQSLRMAMSPTITLLRLSKSFSHAISQKGKEFAEMEGEHEKIRELLRDEKKVLSEDDVGKKKVEECLAIAQSDLEKVNESRALLGEELNRVKLEYDRYVAEMIVKVDVLEFQQAQGYICCYTTTLEHVKFKTPDYDFTDLVWDTELKEGKLMTGGDFRPCTF